MDVYYEAELNLKAANQIGISTSEKKKTLHISGYDLSVEHVSGRKGQKGGFPISPSGLPYTGHMPDVLPKDSITSQSALRTICLRMTWTQVS